MTALGSTLRGLLDKSSRTGETATWRLSRGLRVGVDGSQQRMWLTRDDNWVPHDPKAEHEGRVCAKHLGWVDVQLEWKDKYLIVTRLEGLL